MITAKDAFDDMRRGFLSGTDDYMVKPVNVNEMVLRVGALLRRAQMINERRLVLGGTELLLDSLTVITEDSSCVLPQKEFMPQEETAIINLFFIPMKVLRAITK